MQFVKALSKAFKRFTRQAKNQICVHMGLALRQQPAKIVRRFNVVLSA